MTAVSFPDSVYFTEVVTWADSADIGTVPSFSEQVSISESLATGWVDLFSSAQAVGGSEPVTTGERFTTFSNQIFGPGDYLIKVKLSSLTEKFSSLVVMGKGFRKAAD